GPRPRDAREQFDDLGVEAALAGLDQQLAQRRMADKVAEAVGCQVAHVANREAAQIGRGGDRRQIGQPLHLAELDVLQPILPMEARQRGDIAHPVELQLYEPGQIGKHAEIGELGDPHQPQLFQRRKPRQEAKLSGAAEKQLQLAQFAQWQQQRQVGQGDAAKPEIFKPGEGLNGWQIGPVADEKQLFELRQDFEKTQREFLPRLAEGQLPQTTRQMEEAGDVVELVKGDVETLQIWEVAQEAEVAPIPAVDIKLDVRPVGHQAGRLLQMRSREELVELDDAAI